jgi:hypothetical protein
MFRSLTVIPAMMCAAALVAAQTPALDRPALPSPPATQQPTPEKPRASAASKVTYTGCVKPGTKPDSWILDNADLAKPGGAGASADSASSAIGTSGTMKTTLNLNTKAGTDLKPHANHKVEVVGSIAPANSASKESAQEFNVESIKMVSTTCP